MSSTINVNPGNFANRPKEEVREIAAKGGHASHRKSSSRDTNAVEDINRLTTHASTTNTNPGNFANRPKEEMREIASKGGRASSGGFASMDPEKQVSTHTSIWCEFVQRDNFLVYITA